VDEESLKTDNEKEQEIAKRNAFANISAELKHRKERLRAYGAVNELNGIQMRTYDKRVVYVNLDDTLPPSMIYQMNDKNIDVAVNQGKIHEINQRLGQALSNSNNNFEQPGNNIAENMQNNDE
jgi:hypothetical protein